MLTLKKLKDLSLIYDENGEQVASIWKTETELIIKDGTGAEVVIRR